jgi:dihydroorotate dehydrogenase
MSVLERTALAALRRIDPETAHGLALKALQLGLAPLPRPVRSPILETTLAGLRLQNPLGLAAGFDKNGVALGPLSRAGFGFIEVGATTPRPQYGNPRPRLFRLPADNAAINRFGFNNLGMDAMISRLENRPKQAVLGLNLGANKDSDDRAQDFATVLKNCGPYLNFATVNVSSPNTERLRDLQGRDALTGLLDGVINTRETLANPIPVFLKVAPDLTDADLDDIADVARATKIDGIVATNTTLARDDLTDPAKAEKGGLSGAPLMTRSTEILAGLYQRTDGKIPLIGVGGISSAADAYSKIKAGATALQLYTALSYQGLSLVPEILTGLAELLEADGHTSVEQARGTAT